MGKTGFGRQLCFCFLELEELSLIKYQKYFKGFFFLNPKCFQSRIASLQQTLSLGSSQIKQPTLEKASTQEIPT